MKARTLGVLGTVLGFVACGGNPFGSDTPDSTPEESGGTSSMAGKSSGNDAEAGETAASAGNVGETGGTGVGNDGGSSSTSGGTDAGQAGTVASSGGSDDGAAGEDAGPMEPVFTMSQLIDDMEDGNATLLGSNGDWFVFKDSSAGSITPPKEKPFTMSALSPARGSSTKAAVVTVAGFTDWGAAFGFDFSYVKGVRQQTDLKQALGLRFWAKASKATTLRVQLPNVDTDTLGGRCGGAGENACGAHFTKTVKIGTEWQQTTVVFSDLKQDLPGRHVPSFDKQHVYSAFFVIGPNQSLTVWVDDLALVR